MSREYRVLLLAEYDDPRQLAKTTSWISVEDSGEALRLTQRWTGTSSGNTAVIQQREVRPWRTTGVLGPADEVARLSGIRIGDRS